MKRRERGLIYHITSKLAVTLAIISSIWALLFYFIIIAEINDETDDSLEEYTENIITRALAGEALPSSDNGTNNSYHIVEVTEEYASQVKKIHYSYDMVYIESKRETEPARILKTIFMDKTGRYYEITVSIPTIEKADLRETILYWMILLYLILLVTITGVSALIMRKNFKPLHKLLEWLDNFSVEKGVARLESQTDVIEFKKLTDAVVRSAQRNADVYDQQNKFIGNASHELQTPIAVCMNRLELLASDPDLTPYQVEEILKTQRTLDHLAKLNKTLLLLTKIENGQFPDQRIIVINEIIDEIVDGYSDAYEYLKIETSRNDQGILKVTMNPVLASVLFGNLILNAYTHNRSNGLIDISITADKLRISNTGSPTPLDPKQIFKRFYHTSGQENSSGLGLALVLSICKLYDFKIDYSFTNEKHTFTIQLP